MIVILLSLLLISLASFFVFKNLKSVTSHKLSSTPTNSPYLYQSINQDYKVYLGNRSSRQKPEVKMAVKNSSIEFSPEILPLENELSLNKNKQGVVYKNISPGVDLKYSLIENGLKEEIVINNQQATIDNKQFIFNLNLQNAVPKKDLLGNFSSTFIDPNSGNYLFHFDKPFMVDAGGRRSEQVSMKIITDDNQNYRVKIEPDQRWLNSATYPVAIDPTVVHDEQSDFTSGSLNRIDDIGVGETAPSLRLYEQELPADFNTTGLWHMNETTNDSCSGGQDACDSSGNSNHGTATGTSIETSTPKLGDGARSFNGSSDFINCGNNATLEFTNAITIEAWIKTSTTTAVETAVVQKMQYSSPYAGKELGIKGDDVYFNAGGLYSSNALYGTTDVTDGQWHYIAGVYDGTTSFVYVDGVLDTSAAKTNSLGAPAENLEIGRSYNETRWFNGLIDEVRLSNTARTPEEIKQNAQYRPYGVYTSPSVDFGGTPASLDSLQWTEQLNPPLGTGNDGEITVSTSKNLNTDTLATDRNCADGGDAVNYSVTANTLTGTQQVTLSSTPSSGCLNAGDEILIINLQGSGADFGNVGKYETHYIKSITNDTLTFNDTLQNNYDGTTQKIMVQRVPNYTNVTVDSDQTLTANDWDGTKGGVLFFRANGTVNIDGIISMNNTGYRKSSGSSIGENVTNYQGEGYNGVGTTSRNANYGGGGGGAKMVSNYGQGGGGGAHGTNGTNGSRGSTSTGDYWGYGATAYGYSILSRLFLGGAGGHGGDRYNNIVGGDGGGIIAIFGNTIDISGNVKANGEAGTNASASADNGAGGGGAGGSILIKGSSVTLGSALVTASAGSGGTGYSGSGAGGAGGTGRVAVYYNSSLSGYSSPVSYLGQFSSSLSDIEFQTRTSANNSSWEEWKPVGTGETVLDNMDDFSFWTLPNSSIWSGIPVSTASETTIKVEGLGSIKTTVGSPLVDANTVALWHFDETSIGTGSTTYDSSENENHGVATGTTLIEGFYGKARNFNGASNDYIGFNNPVSLQINNQTICAWVKTTDADTKGYIYSSRDTSAGGGTLYMDANKSTFHVAATGAGATSNTAYADGKWHHVCVTFNDSTNAVTYYLDGTADGSTTNTGTIAHTVNKQIGNRVDGTTTTSFNGSIDEVWVSNTVRSAEEIAEVYRAGRDHRIEKNLSSTDLSSNNKIPFYIASDRLGTYLETYIGETSHSVYQPDANTVGFWHLDEKSGSGAYLKDSSGNNKHATPNGALFTQGKIGGARYFNGSSYYLSRSSVTTYNNSRTVEFWFLPRTTGTQRGILSVGNSVNDTNPMWLITQRATNVLSIYHGGNYRDGTTTITPNVWHHGVYTFNSTGNAVVLYLDGKVEYSGTVADSNTNNTNLYIGTGYNAYFTGLIDEVRISNTARSADEIRQAYQYGLRTHQITVDYSTGIGVSAPTSTADVDFNPTTTTGLYVGDTVIIREKVEATTYIMQGEVTNISSGSVTVASWSGTAPPSGYTTSADVFKWQREYWDISDISIGDRDAITKLGVRVLDGSEGFDAYFDDFEINQSYLTDPTGSEAITSTPQRYFQYRAILTSNDTLFSPSFSSVTIVTTDYSNNLPPTGCIIDDSDHSQGTVVIKWQDNSLQETGYRIEKSIDGEAFSLLSNEAADSTSSTDNNISDNHTYQYQIRAEGSEGNTAWCQTPIINTGIGQIEFKGLNMSGITIE